MRNCLRFWLFLFIVLLAAAGSQASGRWVSFPQGSLEDYPEANLVLSTANEMVFEIKFAGMEVGEIAKQGNTYHTLYIPGGGHTDNVGWPQLPNWSRFIAVPQGAIPQVQIVQYDTEILTDYNVYPAQEHPADRVDAPEPDFTRDEEFYGKDQFYPDRLAFVAEPKVIRGCNVSSLTLFPVQHNPATGELRVVSRMQVRVSFIGGNGTFIDTRLRSSYFEDFFENLLLNYSALETPSSIGGKGDTGCDFLIITHTDFMAWAESLACWKNLSGMPTWVRNTGEIGSDTGSIRAYLKNAYDTWSPPPSFLLLIGDAEFVPLFYRTTHPYDGLKTGTDLYYTTLDGYDYFPDLFPGRISVDNVSEAELVIGKILQYERFPIESPETFYDNALVSSYFQDNDLDDYADRFFIQTSERTRDFLVNKKGKNVERSYTKTSGSTPCCYYYGVPLPAGLEWTGDATQINNAIDNGVFFVAHRDHGSVGGWGHPSYTVYDVNLLDNGNRLPVVLSVDCETGHFDNETDDPEHGTSYSTVYFCEAMLRKANGGAVGILGHTRVSFSGYNDEMMKGLYDAIWPDYDASYPGGTSTHPIYNPLCRMGTMLNFGKFWMYDKYYLTGGAGYPWGAGQDGTKAQFEMATWFGDPTMQIWTEFPETLWVNHPDTISLGETTFPVSITCGGTPVESVYVCLANDQVYQVEYSDGSGELALTCSTLVEDFVHLTATKHNFRPYQGIITLVLPDFVLGDATGDSVIDVADPVFLLNHLFKGGLAPFPYDSGDVTCNGIIDVADAIYLLNFLFKDGLAPNCS